VQKHGDRLGEGYVSSFKELMDDTEWERYGSGNYEKCADCMAQGGYEPTAAHVSASNPLKALWVSLRGIGALRRYLNATDLIVFALKNWPSLGYATSPLFLQSRPKRAGV